MESWNTAAEYFSLMVSRPAPLQYAALCYRKTGVRVEFLLVTSRGTGRWILPKGWAMDKMSGSGAAAREAYEEAGVFGKIMEDPLGAYDYKKWMRGGLPVQCSVRVYALEVERLENGYPENDQRNRQWFSQEEAVELVSEPQLKALISDFNP